MEKPKGKGGRECVSGLLWNRVEIVGVPDETRTGIEPVPTRKEVDLLVALCSEVRENTGMLESSPGGCVKCSVGRACV